MTCIDRFATPEPTAGKRVHIEHATRAAIMIRRSGALGVVNALGDDVQHGKLIDFNRAIRRGGGRGYGWIEWTSKRARDAICTKLEEHSAKSDAGELPFDGKRRMFGDFHPTFDLRRSTRDGES